MKISKHAKLIIKRLFFVILGSFILGFGTGLFLIPYDIVTGGVSGIAILVNSLFGVDKQLMVTILTWFCFFAGWLLLGHEFAIKTIISTVIYPFAVMLGTYLSTLDLFYLGNINELSNSINLFLAGLFGGVLVGTGVGLTFLGGGSSGGIDVITLSFQKFFGFKTSITCFVVDALIVVLNFIFAKENTFGMTLNGIFSAFVASFMLSKLFDTENNMEVTIISKKYDELNHIVNEKIQRGSTIISGVGGYTHEEIKILQVVLDIREYYVLMDIIAKVDPSSFVTVTRLSAVKGQGFKAHQSSVNIGLKKKNDKAK